MKYCCFQRSRAGAHPLLSSICGAITLVSGVIIRWSEKQSHPDMPIKVVRTDRGMTYFVGLHLCKHPLAAGEPTSPPGHRSTASRAPTLPAMCLPSRRAVVLDPTKPSGSRAREKRENHFAVGLTSSMTRPVVPMPSKCGEIKPARTQRI